MTSDELLELETAAIQSIDGELRGPALKAAARIREMEAELAFYKGFRDGVCKNGTHVAVPVEPTLGQRIAGAEKFKELTDGIEAGKLLIGHVYRAMIRAAQSERQQGE